MFCEIKMSSKDGRNDQLRIAGGYEEKRCSREESKRVEGKRKEKEEAGEKKI